MLLANVVTVRLLCSQAPFTLPLYVPVGCVVFYLCISQPCMSSVSSEYSVHAKPCKKSQLGNHVAIQSFNPTVLRCNEDPDPVSEWMVMRNQIQEVKIGRKEKLIVILSLHRKDQFVFNNYTALYSNFEKILNLNNFLFII